LARHINEILRLHGRKRQSELDFRRAGARELGPAPVGFGHGANDGKA
jgi:hypothetical protein